MQGSCEIDASCKLALPGACHGHAANNKLVLPQDFSAAVQQIEVRFQGMCADVIGRCDGLQNIVDQHLQKACDLELSPGKAAISRKSLCRNGSKELKVN